MRRTGRLVLSMVLSVLACQPAFAVEPDDQPWDEIDRVLKEDPGTAAVIDAVASPEASQDTFTPGGPDADPEPGIENDRLQPEPVAVPADSPQSGQMTPTQSEAVDPNATPATSPTGTPSQETAVPELPAPKAEPDLAAPATIPTQPAGSSTVAVDGLLYLPVRPYFETKAAVTLKDFNQDDRAALLPFYDATMGQSLWISKSGLNAAGQALLSEIEKAADWGLDTKAFQVPSVANIASGSSSEDDLVDAEVKLSLVAMQYARHARGGRIQNPTEQLSSYIDRQPQIIPPAKLIEALAAAPDKSAFLRNLHPKHVQFERLRQKLLALRAGAEAEEFEKIPKGPKLSAGKSHAHIGLIRKRLKVPSPGMKPDGTAADENYYDAALSRAVIQFKEKRELEPYNATITTDLRRELNADETVSEDLLLANMEQWRWMPEDLGATHIAVNVPEFAVRVMKDGAIIHDERIVAGRYQTQTPIFSDRMQTVVFKPSWIVPHSIMVNELLPKLRAGGNPIARQGLEIKRNGRMIDAYDVNWNRSDIRNYHVYQPPGPGNVLGVVKFLFPNKHAVYLHDTPSKSLFNSKVRTFSHGCMRVRNPVRLAEVIMAQDKGWDERKVKDLVTRGPGDNDVALETPIPVHVTYFTAWVDDDGTIKTFDDVYGHQKRVVLALAGRWGDIAKNRDHLLPPDINAVPVARSRDNWGNSDGFPEGRNRPAQVTYRAVTPPPPYKKKQSVGDMIQKVFGGN